MSLEDLFQKKLCTCGHNLDEHENGTCYNLTFNGSIYSACDCKHIVLMKLVFRVERNEVSNNPTNKTIRQPKIKPTKPFIVFGRNKENSSQRT